MFSMSFPKEFFKTFSKGLINSVSVISSLRISTALFIFKLLDMLDLYLYHMPKR